MKQKLVSEFIGSAFLLMVVVGSGVMFENLSHSNEALTLLANSLATSAGLFVLIQILSPLSGAHLNPVVSLVEMLRARLDKKELIAYWSAQFSGAVVGVFITHMMFNKSIYQVSMKDRSGGHLWLSEVIATFGLILVVVLSKHKKNDLGAGCVALYISTAYFFTSSTSFANPAVTFARMFTNTFCGIAPPGIVPFMFAQVAGASLAFLLLRKVDLNANKFY